MEFNTIYNNYHSEIERYLCTKINQEDGEELASEVFVKVHNNLNEFNGELACIRTWIWSIAKNLMIDYFRKNRLYTMSIDDDGGDKDDVAIIDTLEDDMNPHRSLESSEIGEHILDAMLELPSAISDVAEKYFIDEKTYKEIEDDLSIPIGTVKAHIFRARKFLQNRLIAFN